MLSLSICLNALSDHGTCTATFVGVAFIMVFILSSIKTLGRVKFVAWVGVAAIMIASELSAVLPLSSTSPFVLTIP